MTSFLTSPEYVYDFVLTRLFVCFQLEKVLQQGDISECADPYIKEEKVKRLPFVSESRIDHL